MSGGPLQAESVPGDVGPPTHPGPRWVVPAYLTVLVICFSPLKSVAYALPGAFVAWGMLVGGLRWRAIRRPLGLLVALCALGLVHALLYEDFLWLNFWVGLVTYSGAGILLLDLSRVTSLPLIRRLFRLTAYFLVVQACYGIVQALYSAFVVGAGSFDISTGDAVKGTINPTLVGDGVGSNQMYAILLSMSLIAIYPSRRLFFTRAEGFFLAVIGLGWVLASVMHTVIFAIVAVVIGIALVPSGKRRWFSRLLHRTRMLGGGVVVACLVLVAAGSLLPANLGMIPFVVRETVDSFGRSQAVSPKVLATLNTVLSLPEAEEAQPLVGLGLGQYSSRAGLIVSGTYLTAGSILPSQGRLVSQNLIYDLQEGIRNQNVGSSFFPYYSWLSLYGEFGLLGLITVLLAVTIMLIRIRRAQRAPSSGPEVASLGQSVVIALLYLLLLGFQDNYWEFAQAILPPLILIKLSYDFVVHSCSAEAGSGSVAHGAPR